MKPQNAGTLPLLEDKAFLALVVVVSAIFAWIIWPFYGVVFWGTALAILFMPLYHRLLRSLWRKPTLAALATLAIILVMVILPLALIMTLMLREAAGVYQRVQSGDLNFGRYFQQIFDALPAWISALLDRLGMADLGLVKDRISAAFTNSSRFLASKALAIGQNTLDFVASFLVLIYLLFFLLRDGEYLSERIKDSLPLRSEHLRELSSTFTAVLRATVKGTLVVAMIQGALGGLIFWILRIHAPILWGVLMAVLSLLPAIGAALVWLPVAIHLLVIGSTWQGLVLLAWGALVIGLIDNVLRPILVGKEARMPDYVVLVSTLGGIATFGINGLVIGPVIAAMFIAVWDILYRSRVESGGGPDPRIPDSHEG
ncbi:MAG TPA: AI-2E family transporter [Thermoanaerobaculia bacterium]|nr:AI-2E family transporter [Thermoanaerobaculia bacterium]